MIHKHGGNQVVRFIDNMDNHAGLSSKRQVIRKVLVMLDKFHSMVHNTHMPPSHDRSCEAYTLVISILNSQTHTRTPSPPGND
jgi:hypothetical protein